MYSCNGKAEISASLLQSSVSRDLSEIILKLWFGAYRVTLGNKIIWTPAVFVHLSTDKEMISL